MQKLTTYFLLIALFLGTLTSKAQRNKRAQNLLNWQSLIPFEEGLKATITWFRQYLDVFYSPDSSLSQL